MRLLLHMSTVFNVTLLIAAANEERCAVCREAATTNAAECTCRRCSNCGVPTNESTRLSRTSGSPPVPLIRTPSSRRLFRRRTFVSRVHQSSTTISDTAHGTRRGEGSRSAHEFPQRVVSRIRRPKRRQHSPRRERLPKQTQLLI